MYILIFCVFIFVLLSLIKQFIKTLGTYGDCFSYLCQAFPELTMEKFKTGIFDGPQIRQLNRDPELESSIKEVEMEVWKAFVLILKNFLGNNKAKNYVELVKHIVTAFWNLGCNMSINMHYLYHIWTGFLRTWVQWVTSMERYFIRT